MTKLTEIIYNQHRGNVQAAIKTCQLNLKKWQTTTHRHVSDSLKAKKVQQYQAIITELQSI